MQWIVYGFWLCFAVFVLGQLYLSIRQSRTVLKHRHAVPADFAQTVTLTEHQKAADYTLAKQRVARYDLLFQAAILWLFTFGGGLNVLALLSARLTSVPFYQEIWLVMLFLLVNMVLGWPLSLYRTFYLESRFGFNRTTWTTWVMDQIKGLILGAIIGVPLVVVVIYLMGAMGSLWWLYVWGFWLLFSLTMIWAFPRWIAPWFNRFEPLSDTALKTRIEQLLQRTGFASNGIFVMDGSKRSGHGNAYFTGLGKNKRIVFFDTLLNDMLPEEVEAVLAHELGHFAHRHIIKQMVVSFALALVVLFVLGLLLPQASFFHSFGVAYPSHAMALLLFFLVLPVFLFPFSPLSSLMSRKNEFEADAFAAQHTAAHHLINALTKLYRTNAASLVSDEWYSRFYDSHPNAQTRIAALRAAMKHNPSKDLA